MPLGAAGSWVGGPARQVPVQHLAPGAEQRSGWVGDGDNKISLT